MPVKLPPDEFYTKPEIDGFRDKGTARVDKIEADVTGLAFAVEEIQRRLATEPPQPPADEHEGDEGNGQAPVEDDAPAPAPEPGDGREHPPTPQPQPAPLDAGPEGIQFFGLDTPEASGSAYASFVLPHGSRVNGTTTLEIGEDGRAARPVDAAKCTIRLNGRAQPSNVIDFDALPRGHYAAECIPEPSLGLMSWSQTFINATGEPVTAARLPVHGALSHGRRHGSAAHVWVPLREPRPAPLRLTDLRAPKTEADRAALRDGWWTAHGTPTALYLTTQYEARNLQGDNFIQQWNPQITSDVDNAPHAVGASPCFDGARNVRLMALGWATFARNHGPGKDWVGILNDGTVFDFGIDFDSAIWYGARSVGRQTDHTLWREFGLRERIARGEKVLAGADESGYPNLFDARDIWQDPDDHDLYWVAHYGGNRIAVLSRSQRRIVSEFPADRPKSVATCHHPRSRGVKAYFVNATGLWEIGEAVSKLHDIDGAAWCRVQQNGGVPGTSSSVIVMTDRFAFWEDGELRQPPQTSTAMPFVFFDQDENGVTGYKKRLYYSGINYGSGNTGLGCVDPGPGGWPDAAFFRFRKHPVLKPRMFHIGEDWHYPWYFTCHHMLPCVLMGGISNHEPVMYVGSVGEQPPARYPEASADDYTTEARNIYRDGIRGVVPPLLCIFGGGGSNRIGHSVTDLDYLSKAEARSYLAPWGEALSGRLTSAQWENTVNYLYLNAERDRL